MSTITDKQHQEALLGGLRGWFSDFHNQEDRNMAASRADMVRLSDSLGRELAEALNMLQDKVDALELKVAQLESELDDYIDGIIEFDEAEYHGK